jgi:photosystem II stability/assembly factor-like uncharacterized protein
MKLLTPQVGWTRSGQHLYWTADAGIHWKDIVPSMSSEESLGGVFFLDTSTGWVLLSHADDQDHQQFRVASTNDAGTTWSVSPIKLPWKRLPEDFAGGAYIFFLDQLHGWMDFDLRSSSSFAPGRLLVTDDGGKTWTASSGDSGEAGSLCFFSETDGLLSGGPQSSELWATHDGSKTWQQLSLKAPPTASPADLPTYGEPICKNAKQGFLPVTYTPTDYPDRETFSTVLVLFATDDAGKTWKVDKVLPGLPDISHGYALHSTAPDSSLIAVTQSGGVVTLAIVAPNNEVRRMTLGGFKEAPDLSFVDTSHGWASTQNGMFSTTDGGASWIQITPSQTVPPSTPKTKPPKRATGSESIVSPAPSPVERAFPQVVTASGKEIHLGFDTGRVPSPGVMQTWWNYSPYYDYQISLPGAANHRTNPGLNASWVSTVEGYGWGLWPVWVGPQATCQTNPSSITVRIDSSHPAYPQGQAEATKAINALQALGGNLAGTIIYYDMENYNTSDPVCVPIVRDFLNGWINGMHSNVPVYQAGVYGNVAPAALNFSQLSPLPDDVWVTLAPGTQTAPQVTIWNLASSQVALCDQYSASPCPLWSTHQRIHQYLIDTGALRYTETWGGQPLIIDPDIVDADVAQPSSGTKTYTYNFTSFQPDGNVAFPYSINNIGITPNYGGFIKGSQSDVSGNIGQILEFWEQVSGGQIVDSGNLLYNPDNNTYQFPPGYPNTGQCGGLLVCPTSASSMNNAGWIVGTWSDSNHVGHGFVNKGGVFTSIDYPGAVGFAATEASAINDAGLVVGLYTDFSNNRHGYVYNSKTNLFVGAPIDHPAAAGITELISIDGYGRIIGRYFDGNDYQPFLYVNGTFTGITGCGTGATAMGINNNGQIVGFNTSPSTQAFITNDYGATCIPLSYPGGSPFAEAFSINDAGQISGQWFPVGSNLPNGFVAVPQTP